jgi:hypothetical protein
MLSVAFTSPRYLVGLAGAALPLLIHLLTRDRVQRVIFPSLRFFARTARASLVRRRFEEILLIALRCLLCAVLAVAFANPLLARQEDAAEFGPDSRSRVLLVDRSASIRRQPVLDAWRSELESMAKSVNGQARTAVIAFDSETDVLADFDASPDEVRGCLDRLQPGYGSSDQVGALRKARDLIERERTAIREIILLSDLPRRGWQTYRGDWRLPAGVTLTVRPLPGVSADNLRIVEANVPVSQVGTAKACRLGVRVVNDGAADLKNVEVSLLLGDDTSESHEVSLPAGRASAVRFRQMLQDGDNAGVIRIEREDAIPLDNEVYFNIAVQPKLHVVILNGHPSSVRREDAAFFLETALSVGEPSHFEVQVLDAANADPAEVGKADVVLLADVATISDAVGRALGEVLGRGGGLLLLPGGHVDGEAFSRSFRELAPCGLREVIEPSGTAAPARIGDVRTDHAALRVFDGARNGNFATIRFRRYWEVTRSQTARVLARFQDGRPALLEKQRHQGVSMMSLTPPDLAWTDFPQRALFVPYVHELVRYLGARKEEQTALVVGQPLPEGEATDPDGKKLSTSGAVARAPGIYAIRPPDGPARKVAVNVDRAEFDTRAVEPEEIVEALRPVETESERTDPAQSRHEQAGLWMWVLLLFACLTVAELAMANRTVRH